MNIKSLLVVALLLGACGRSRPYSYTPRPDAEVDAFNFYSSALPVSTFPDETGVQGPLTPDALTPNVGAQEVFPQHDFPEVTFPEATFPQVSFAEVTSPDIKIQRGAGKVIYSLPTNLLFDSGTLEMRAGADDALEQVATAIAKRTPRAELHINGHTDTTGESSYNLELSKQQAYSVSQWLIERANVEAARIIPQGLGETQPVATDIYMDGTDNMIGRQQNRRVEIVTQLPQE